MSGLARRRMTADEFLDWVVDQEEHYELIDGQPLMFCASCSADTPFRNSDVPPWIAPASGSRFSPV